MSEMFTKSRPNYIESSDGFSVRVARVGRLIYREADHEMPVGFEFLAGPSVLAVYRCSISHWEAPYHGEPVTDVDRDRILGNIRAAFRWDGSDIEVF